jgi:hypothetical protein
MLALTGFRFIDIFKSPVHLDLVAAGELEGAYAYIRVSDIEGTFARYGAEAAEGETEVDIVERYCVYVVDNDKYLGIAIKGSHLADIEQFSAAMESFGEEKARSMDFGTLTGTVQPMDEELQVLLREWVKQTVLTEPSVVQGPYTTEEQEETPEQLEYYEEHVLPLILKVDTMGASSKTVVYIFFILAMLFLVIAVLLILSMFLGIWDKPVRQLAAGSDSAALEKDFSEGKSVGSALHIGHTYIWWFKKAKTDVLKTAEIVWVYPRSKRLEGGRLRWSLILKTEDRREYAIVLGEIEKVQEAMDAIVAEGYLVSTGFDKQKQKLYDKDISAFKARIKKEYKEKEETETGSEPKDIPGS